MGFAGVMAGPLVRSSYRAGRLYAQTVLARGEQLPSGLEHLAAEARPPRRHARCWPGSHRMGGTVIGPAPYPVQMAAGKPDKAAKKEARRAKRAESKRAGGEIWEVFKMQRRKDKALIPLMVGAVVLAVALAFGIGLIWGMEWILLPFGIMIGLLAAFSIFGRRAQRSVYAQAEGQPGAAGWALDNMRGQWRVTMGVDGNTHLDAVHRVIGRPGIVLVGEGSPHRVKALIAQQKKRIARVVGQTPIYEVVVGNEEGQIPLGKLQRHMTKLPRNISPKDMESLEKRLAALGSRTTQLPKGRCRPAPRCAACSGRSGAASPVPP